METGINIMREGCCETSRVAWEWFALGRSKALKRDTDKLVMSLGCQESQSREEMSM